MFDPSFPSLLALVRCPVTGESVDQAGQEIIDKANSQIQLRTLCDRIGNVVESNLDSGLVNESGTLLLAVREGIVSLIADQTIPMEQIDPQAIV